MDDPALFVALVTWIAIIALAGVLVLLGYADPSD